MSTEAILAHFRLVNRIPDSHRLAVQEVGPAGVLVVMQSDEDGSYVATHQVRPVTLGGPEAVSFITSETPEMTAEQSRMFDVIWAKWKLKIEQGRGESKNGIELMEVGEEPELFRFRHFNNIGGNVVEDMMPVWFNLEDQVEALGMTVELSSDSQGRKTLRAHPRERRAGH
jgi:hypothetical protein